MSRILKDATLEKSRETQNIKQRLMQPPTPRFLGWMPSEALPRDLHGLCWPFVHIKTRQRWTKKPTMAICSQPGEWRSRPRRSGARLRLGGKRFWRKFSIALFDQQSWMVQVTPKLVRGAQCVQLFSASAVLRMPKTSWYRARKS